MGFAANYFQAKGQAGMLQGQATSSRNQATLTRLQGEGEKKKAEADAQSIETAARLNNELEAEKQRQTRKNQSAAAASARNSRTGSGFMLDEGTGGRAEESALEMYERGIANMAQSASIASLNAQQRAISTRREGDMAQMQANINAMGYDAEAAMYEGQARGIRKGARIGLIGGLIGSGLGVDNGFYNAYNAKRDQQIRNKEQVGAGNWDALSAGFQGAAAGGVLQGQTGWDLATGYNPYMAPYTINYGRSVGEVFSLFSPDPRKNNKNKQQGESMYSNF